MTEGTAEVPVARTRARIAVAICGAAVWLLATLLQTRASGVAAIATQFVFIAALLLLTTATRTVTVPQLLPFFFLGGALLGVAVLGGLVLQQTGSDSVVAVTGIPVLKEALTRKG